MRVFGITGYSGAGKTTLVEALLPVFSKRAQSVSVIKHTHHDFDLDRPGKDSHRMREAGATEVMLVGEKRWVLMREQSQDRLTLDHQLARLADVDLVIVEGFRDAPIPKLEVWRSVDGRAARFGGDTSIVLVAVDGDAPPGCALPVLQLGETERLADAIWRHAKPHVPHAVSSPC